LGAIAVPESFRLFLRESLGCILMRYTVSCPKRVFRAESVSGTGQLLFNKSNKRRSDMFGRVFVKWIAYVGSAELLSMFGAATRVEAQCTGCSSPPSCWQTTGNCACSSQHFLGTTNGADLDFMVNNARAFRLEHRTGSTPYPNVIGGRSLNSVDSDLVAATISGGDGNTISGAGANWGTIGGGRDNCVQNLHGSVVGGIDNCALGEKGIAAGGQANQATGRSTFIGGGEYNEATAEDAAVGGGYLNMASGIESMIPGGEANVAGGQFSFAAGRRAKVRTASQVGGGDTDGDQGTFIWADSQDADITSTGHNQFIVRASGNMWLGTSSSPSFTSGRFINTSTGAYLTTGGTWTNSSDRDAKENFEPLNVHLVLERVAELPVTRWNFKTEGPGVQHLGPMAQDFHAAFGLGDGNTAIGTLDADGVALAAIQSLNEKRLVRQVELAEARAFNQVLESRVTALEAALAELIPTKYGHP
jgi:hypothetical protein